MMNSWWKSSSEVENHQLVLFEVLYFFCACFFLEFLKIEATEKPLKTEKKLLS